MSSHVPAVLRRHVFSRARHVCEYCLIHESDTYLGLQIEHVISEKHGGETVAENLAAACAFCNRFKGSDISTLSQTTGHLIRLFNPRLDNWRDHFRLEGFRIAGRTEIGRATAELLGFNSSDRIEDREFLGQSGRFPSTAALQLISRGSTK